MIYWLTNPLTILSSSTVKYDLGLLVSGIGLFPAVTAMMMNCVNLAH